LKRSWQTPRRRRSWQMTKSEKRKVAAAEPKPETPQELKARKMRDTFGDWHMRKGTMPVLPDVRVVER